MKDLTNGLKALSTSEEQAEVVAVLKGNGPRLRLQYLKESKQKMGLALWNVLSPKVLGYRYGPDDGYPTFSLNTLQAKGLVPIKELSK